MISTKEAQALLDSKTKSSTIVFLDSYHGDKELHNFKCLVCGHIWSTTPNYLKRQNHFGCLNCYKIANQQQTDNSYFSKSGTKKLLSSKTSPVENNWLTEDEIKQINEYEQEVYKLIMQLPLINEEIQNCNLKIDELNKQIAIMYKEYKKSFNFNILLIILLFPFWLRHELKYSNMQSPLRDKIQLLEKEIYQKNNNIKHINSNIQALNDSIKELKQNKEYTLNINRLSSRLNIKVGGKTNLYYFRFEQNNIKYYKIGISINGVDLRYRNKDGTLYRRIEKIFFDLPIKDASRLEKLILHTFSSNLANDPSLLKSKGGYTEVFNRDVLDLDTYGDNKL